MQLHLSTVDAFTSRLFHGNPAAVCVLQQWLPDDLMQQIAAENNLSETAFLVEHANHWQLRWFTPTVEVELCGHATLATAFVLARMHPRQVEFRFDTKSGELIVTRQQDLFTLDFPARPLESLPRQLEVDQALGLQTLTLTRSGRTLIAELVDDALVKTCTPDFAAITRLDCRALVITAHSVECDFVSRFFAPKVGVDEDPVTGSAHCSLVPFWSARLGKTQLQARQLSKRGGELLCELKGERVLMSGHAVLYSESTIYIPDA